MTEQHPPQNQRDLLQQGIKLARAGQHKEARAVLEQVIRADETNEIAWIWMASVVGTNAQRRTALEIVLEINPENERAREALAKLGGSRASRKAAAAQSIADRIGSTETIDEADFQVMVDGPTPEPVSPDPTPTDAEKEATTARVLLEAARAEEAARVEEIARAKEAAAAAQGLPEPSSATPTVEYYDFKRERRAKRLRRMRNALGVLLAIIAGIALIALFIESAGSFLQSLTPPPTPTNTPGLQTALAMLASETPTPEPEELTLEDLNRREEFYFPASWTPAPTGTATVTPSPTSTPPPLAEYRLIFSGRSAEEPAFNLYTIWADGRALAPFTTAGTNDRDPAFAPVGEQVLFVSDVDEAREVAVLPLTGDEAGLPSRLLTTLGAVRLGSPSWSPDGSRVVFSAYVNDREDLYLMSSDGTELINLTVNMRGQATDPAWSPDGQWIAFAADRARRYDVEVYRMRADGTRIEQLTNDPGSSFQPAWSPDSQSIAFVSDRDNDADLYVMNADGSGRHRLARNNDYEERDPAWSPDGRWVAFSANRDSAVFQIYLLDPISGQIIQVTDERADFMEPAWLVAP